MADSNDLPARGAPADVERLRQAVIRPQAPRSLPGVAPGAENAAAPVGFRRIELDYEICPRPRPLRTGPGGRRLLAQLAGSVAQARALAQRIARFRPELARIPVGPSSDPRDPHWVNGWFPAGDAMMLYGLLALRNPRYYVEVGSGYSTRFARRAVRDHGLRTRILSIDPAPRAEVDALCDEVVREPLESIDVARVSELTHEDLLFVDSSHRALQNSDVTVFFTEILPALPAGLLFGMHDIVLPSDYPAVWRERFYSEQYLLACYLAGGADGDEIVAPLAYLSHETDALASWQPVFDGLGLERDQRTGTSFWMQRAAR